jgi:hypothetical protein
LKHEQRLLEIFGVFHFGDQAEEGNVGAVGKNYVGNSLESGVESGVDCRLDNAAGVILQTDRDHGNHDGAKNAEERWKIPD